MNAELGELKVVFTAEQIAARVRELADKISGDYRGRTVYAVCVLENGFVFMADLVRALDVPVVCQFMKPETREVEHGAEIFFSPEVNVQGKDVLLVEGIVQSGVTQEFLMRNLTARGAVSVKLATLLDKQAERRVALQADYSGYALGESYVLGYGLGSPLLGRNLPYVASAANTPAAASG
ncbi:MAG TPA: phosphoribosyltransferase family protein [Terriglobales bacterium]|nr:phosphoribosyltransferase family protein [Terriglobales bacterium]